MDKRIKVAILGAGSWGCALAHVLLDNGHKVSIWTIDEKERDMLNNYKEQQDKLPGVLLSGDVSATSNIEEAILDANVIIMAVPSVFVRNTSKLLKDIINDNQIIVDVAKGIEEETLLTLSQQIKEESGSDKIVVLSGPSHAEEVGKNIPTAVVAASTDLELSKYIQSIFMNNYFRVYTSLDVHGVELAAALKNVIALAAGMADGLGTGDNTKAALITRGAKEVADIGVASGGNVETFYGLAGIGDLIVTCGSQHSRNRKAGYLIGKGYSYEEAMKEVKMIVEGVYSACAAYNLAKKHNIEAPIIFAVYDILFNNKKARESLVELMHRDGKME